MSYASAKDRSARGLQRIEALALFADELRLSGAVWDVFRNLGQHFNLLGFLIIGLFAASWAGSWGFYRLQRLDDIEVTRPS